MQEYELGELDHPRLGSRLACTIMSRFEESPLRSMSVWNPSLIAIGTESDAKKLWRDQMLPRTREDPAPMRVAVGFSKWSRWRVVEPTEMRLVHQTQVPSRGEVYLVTVRRTELMLMDEQSHCLVLLGNNKHVVLIDLGPTHAAWKLLFCRP